MIAEETTVFGAEGCAECGCPAFNTAENGVACDRCGRRVVWPALVEVGLD